MKPIFVLFFLLMGCIVVGQKQHKFFFNEVGISVNRTTVKDYNTENRTGFGAGIYHTFNDNKPLSFVIGWEYNRINQFKKSIYESRFSSLTNVHYHINYLTMPVTLRGSIGGRTKVFADIGWFFDVEATSHKIGTRRTASGYSQIKKDGDLETTNHGPQAGIGIKTHWLKHEVSIGVEYRKGLTMLYDYLDNVVNRYARLRIGVKF